MFSLGWGQDYEDMFFSWFEKREIQEKGAVLVRPDRTVAWRCGCVPEEGRFSKMMRSVLGFENGAVDGLANEKMQRCKIGSAATC